MLQMSIESENSLLLTTALSFDTISPANPDEYRHKCDIARKHRPWATS